MKNEPSKLEQLIEMHALTLLDVGALSRLTIACRRNHGSMPSDHALIYEATLCRTDAERMAVLSMLNLFFDLRDGIYYPKAEVA